MTTTTSQEKPHTTRAYLFRASRSVQRVRERGVVRERLHGVDVLHSESDRGIDLGTDWRVGASKRAQAHEQHGLIGGGCQARLRQHQHHRHRHHEDGEKRADASGGGSLHGEWGRVRTSERASERRRAASTRARTRQLSTSSSNSGSRSGGLAPRSAV